MDREYLQIVEGFEGSLYECSQCGHLFEDDPDYDECPNCGRGLVIPKKNLQNNDTLNKIKEQFYHHK